jgi:hypothetical protein
LSSSSQQKFDPPPGPVLPHAGGRIPLAWVQLLIVHASLTREMDAHLRAEHGLSLTSYEVLFALSTAPGQRMRRVDLANRLFVSQGGVTRLLAGLETAGLVARAASESDARVFYATLTDGSWRRPPKPTSPTSSACSPLGSRPASWRPSPTYSAAFLTAELRTESRHSTDHRDRRRLDPLRVTAGGDVGQGGAYGELAGQAGIGHGQRRRARG